MRYTAFALVIILGLSLIAYSDGIKVESFSVTTNFEGKSFTITGNSEDAKIESFSIQRNLGIKVKVNTTLGGEMELTLPTNLIDRIYDVIAYGVYGASSPYREIFGNSSATKVFLLVPAYTQQIEIRGVVVPPKYDLPYAKSVISGISGSYPDNMKGALVGMDLRYTFQPRLIENFVIIGLIIDSEGYPYQIFHANASYIDSYCGRQPLGEDILICTGISTTMNQLGDYTFQIYTWTDLQTPIPLADVASHKFTLFERNLAEMTSEVRKGDLSLSINTAQSVYSSPAKINVTLLITNLGDIDLKLKGESESPISISLYEGREAVYRKLGSPSFYVPNSCFLYDGQDNKIVMASSVLTLRAHEILDYTCVYSITGEKLMSKNYAAVGNLIGFVEPWDKEESGKSTDLSALVITEPIRFLVKCIICD